MRCRFRWGTLIAVGLALVWFAGGWYLIDFMTTSEPVRDYARDFLWIAALCIAHRHAGLRL